MLVIQILFAYRNKQDKRTEIPPQVIGALLAAVNFYAKHIVKIAKIKFFFTKRMSKNQNRI